MYCPPPSVSCYACIMHATAQQSKSEEPSTAAKAKNQTDQTDQERKTPKPERKQKGLGANPGLETSQNSHSPSAKTFCT